MNLSQLPPGKTASVTSIAPSPLTERLIDLGFLGRVQCIAAPPHGMHAYLVGGALIALRPSDASRIGITPDD